MFEVVTTKLSYQTKPHFQQVVAKSLWHLIRMNITTFLITEFIGRHSIYGGLLFLGHAAFPYLSLFVTKNIYIFCNYVIMKYIWWWKHLHVCTIEFQQFLERYFSNSSNCKPTQNFVVKEGSATSTFLHLFILLFTSSSQ